MALRDIVDSNIGAGDRAVAIRRAVVVAMLGVTALNGHATSAMGTTGADAAVSDFEGAVAVVAAVSPAGQRVSVTEAKRVLRSYGAAGVALASRLGRCPKLRNGPCHPDKTLALDIGRLLGTAATTAPAIVPIISLDTGDAAETDEFEAKLPEKDERDEHHDKDEKDEQDEKDEDDEKDEQDEKDEKDEKNDKDETDERDEGPDAGANASTDPRRDASLGASTDTNAGVTKDDVTNLIAKMNALWQKPNETAQCSAQPPSMVQDKAKTQDKEGTQFETDATADSVKANIQDGDREGFHLIKFKKKGNNKHRSVSCF
eukprot:CAMPEP_0204529192 /NCGR_PEP_ID=MMETSP0661-20131031/9930_1 /ASSEMBLY_ACC=CAM_ASM_000606 /TAXON_ID=109239 /ORGANISM="Alexandrium margalefi, Strain AMGDE01CS-322" /LENGTH=315 /DNA_ID=CAMNT_0051535205 /DNA_START=71 /DNA_END=1018 /DNA_ORIENTATION=-